MTDQALAALVDRIRDCRLCADELPQVPRPIFQLSRVARVLLVGQAPGRLAHERGRPWDDPSGKRLRRWLDVDRTTFYGPHFAILPAGLCFPGTLPRGGDKPPTRRCAPTWHPVVREHLTSVRTVIALGRFAHALCLTETAPSALWQRVANWRAYAPELWLLPHPSWRNNADLRRNPWFEQDLVPALQAQLGKWLKES